MERSFRLDPFQVEATEVLASGKSVLVAAPTGAGKTVVAEFAVAEAQELGEKVFYTTPIKALSNQKYRDFREQYGADAVGLLTGDNAVNPNASVVVMTTEVLRNMLYAGSDLLDGLRYVVMDEVHYLQDAYRGAVWEEVIIHLPKHVRLVALSATVSNADEFSDWITEIRGETVAVVETTRPVELKDLYATSERGSGHLHVVPVLIKGNPNREAFRFDVQSGKGRQGGKQRGRRPFATPRRIEIISYLRKRDLLPAIFFIFSRAGCDDAVSSAYDRGMVLTSKDEQTRIGEIAAARTAHLSENDLEALEYDKFHRALINGFAAHHAGMVPAFKETVELCFVEGLVKAVFATETLAMGINMPARTVVLDKLTKFTGEHHESLTPGQYTQLTGRAGRRGIDPVGHAIVLWSPYVTFDQVARLAGSSSFPLRSSFRPSYNMAVNMVRRVPEDGADELLRQSFAQYQTDRAVVKLTRKAEKQREDIARAEAAMTVDRATVEASLGETVQPRGRDSLDADATQAVLKSLSRLEPGDVLASSEVHDQAVVISSAFRRGQPRIKAVTALGDVVVLEVEDFAAPPDTIGRLELPEPYAPNSDRFQATVGHELGRASFGNRNPKRGGRRHLSVVGDDRVNAGGSNEDRLNRSLLEQIHEAEQRLAKTTEKIENRDGSITRQFAAVRSVLEELGYLDGWELTGRGETLVQVYHERDLLISEALMSGLLDGLDEAELAGMVSGFTYEHRSATPAPPPWFPSKTARTRFKELEALHARINKLERANGLPLTNAPDGTLFAAVHGWALGGDLDDVLERDITGGDFVRQAKQIIDLLRQIGTAALDPETRHAARAAAERLDRGVVTASGAVGADEDGDDSSQTTASATAGGDAEQGSDDAG